MSTRTKFTTIDEYLKSASPDARPHLEEIRRIIRDVAPAADETISCQMPAFRQGRIFINFAAFKKHIGIYPPVSGDEALVTALQPYRNEKGNLRFPIDRPLPSEMIRQVAEVLLGQYGK